MTERVVPRDGEREHVPKVGIVSETFLAEIGGHPLRTHVTVFRPLPFSRTEVAVVLHRQNFDDGWQRADELERGRVHYRVNVYDVRTKRGHERLDVDANPGTRGKPWHQGRRARRRNAGVPPTDCEVDVVLFLA